MIRDAKNDILNNLYPEGYIPRLDLLSSASISYQFLSVGVWTLIGLRVSVSMIDFSTRSL